MLGNITRWTVFSAPGEGKIHDIVSSLKKRGGGIQNFCDNLRGKVHGNPTVIYVFAHSIKVRKVNYAFPRDLRWRF